MYRKTEGQSIYDDWRLGLYVSVIENKYVAKNTNLVPKSKKVIFSTLTQAFEYLGENFYRFHLSRRKFLISEVKEILSCLPKTVKMFSLSYLDFEMNLGERTKNLPIQDILEVLNALPLNITILRLSDFNLESSGLNEFKSILSKLPSHIKQLRLPDNSLNELSIEEIIELVKAIASTVTSIYLRKNELHQFKVEDILKLVKSIPQHITSFQLFNRPNVKQKAQSNFIKENCVRIVLAWPSHIRQFDLNYFASGMDLDESYRLILPILGSLPSTIEQLDITGPLNYLFSVNDNGEEPTFEIEKDFVELLKNIPQKINHLIFDASFDRTDEELKNTELHVAINEKFKLIPPTVKSLTLMKLYRLCEGEIGRGLGSRLTQFLKSLPETIDTIYLKKSDIDRLCQLDQKSVGPNVHNTLKSYLHKIKLLNDSGHLLSPTEQASYLKSHAFEVDVPSLICQATFFIQQNKQKFTPEETNCLPKDLQEKLFPENFQPK